MGRTKKVGSGGTEDHASMPSPTTQGAASIIPREFSSGSESGRHVDLLEKVSSKNCNLRGQ